MFGENSMYGTRVQKTDDKSRIILPKFTHSEEGEQVVVVKDDDGVSVYSLEYVDTVVKSLEKKIANESDENIKNKLKDELDKYLCSLVTISNVDFQGRISTCCALEKGTMYKIVGARTYIKIKTL